MDRETVIRAIRPVVVMVAVLWAVAAVNALTGYWLNHALGLEPRRLAGLIGIPAMPFLHAGFAHLTANTLPLVVLGILGIVVAGERFLGASVAIIFLSGAAVWLFGRAGITVGASGMIFGWFGYLVTLGVIERSFRTLAGTIIVVIFYGGMLWGVLPQEQGISWESHLLGALAGGCVAWLSRIPSVSR